MLTQQIRGESKLMTIPDIGRIEPKNNLLLPSLIPRAHHRVYSTTKKRDARESLGGRR